MIARVVVKLSGLWCIMLIFSVQAYAQTGCGCGAGVHAGGAQPSVLGAKNAPTGLSALSASQSEQYLPVYGESQESLVESVSDSSAEVHDASGHGCPYGKCPCAHKKIKKQMKRLTREIVWVTESEYADKSKSDTPYELYTNADSPVRNWNKAGQLQNLYNIILVGTKARSSAVDLYEELKANLGDSEAEQIRELLSTLHKSNGDEEKASKAVDQYNRLIKQVGSQEVLSNPSFALQALRDYFQKL